VFDGPGEEKGRTVVVGREQGKTHVIWVCVKQREVIVVGYVPIETCFQWCNQWCRIR
jgi:negative regulator of sigma E activity